MLAGEHVALVTGGSRGIGEAIARRIAREGATVLIAARDEARCKEVAEDIRSGGGHAWPLVVDVTRYGIAPRNIRELDIVTAPLKVLRVEHVIAGLVLRVDLRRIERIDDIEGREEQPVAPGDRLAAGADHGALARISNREPIQPVQQHRVAAL